MYGCLSKNGTAWDKSRAVPSFSAFFINVSTYIWDVLTGVLYETIVDSTREIGYNENTRGTVDLTVSPRG